MNNDLYLEGRGIKNSSFDRIEYLPEKKYGGIKRWLIFDSSEHCCYRFSETNMLDDKVLASSGEYSDADNVSVAIRSYGDYSYTLSVW
jgi:hypothetical protein